MALLADQSADVNSNLVGGAGTQTKRFTMPGNVAIKVESVVATVNNGAGSAVTPELTIKDQSGVVIATTKQGDSIPAGDTGTATYALRLTDKGASTATGFIRYDFLNVGNWLDIEATGNGPSGQGFNLLARGGVQIDATNDAFVTFMGNGLYEIDANGGTYQLNTSGGTVQIGGSGATISISAPGAGTIDIASGLVTLSEQVNVRLAVGTTFQVLDSAGAPIFRVDEDGDLHGLTGKALVFDL